MSMPSISASSGSFPPSGALSAKSTVVANERRHAHGAAGDAEHGFGLRAAADHVHVDVCLDACRVRVPDEIHDAAFDLGGPEEAYGARRTRQHAFVDERHQTAGDLEDGHTP
jgi:hypothetical protein